LVFDQYLKKFYSVQFRQHDNIGNFGSMKSVTFSTWAKVLLTIGLFFAMANEAWATHLRAGEITATRVCPSRTYRICLNIFVNTDPNETQIKFGGGDLYFGDGNKHVPDEQNSTPFGDPADYVGYVQYCVEYTYSGPGTYHITYNEKNRNEGILNMTNSVGTTFFLETIIEIDPFKGCDNSPRLLVPPIDKACSGAAWFHNPGAYDIDGDSLSYQMIVPRRVVENGPPVEVMDYTLPNNQLHYDGFTYGNAQEDGSGTPTFSIDPVDGTIIWDAPGEAGEYNIAFLVIEYRKINDVWQRIGSITRDMQIIVEDCDNKRPILEVPADICVEAGEFIEAEIFGTDPDRDEVIIEVFSQALILDISPATYAPKDQLQSTFPQKAKVTFSWQTHCAHVKQQPYQVVVKITDKPANGATKLVSFATWNITVVGPAPKWDAIAAVPVRSAQLGWKPYDCAAYADSMQVWRRIDSTSYAREECVVGMPEGLGYEKIKTLRINQTNYLDTNEGKGLPPGAVVCYRLVALFPPAVGNTEGGTESYVSDEVCIGPMLVDAPVITHVTVDTTDTQDGQITVRWTPPFDLDPIAFPPPYNYVVYRATGFSGNISLTKLDSTQRDTLVDKGINTFNNAYNYRIMSYDGTGTPLDTSAIASSVWLKAKSLIGKIELSWEADVPWSLTTPTNRFHDIYRGNEGDKEDDFVKIAEIESTNGILKYTDQGPLQDNQLYCYRVLTRGGYGFDDTSKVPDPLINYSQIVCAQPSDTVPPCKPVLTMTPELDNCEEYFVKYGCNFNNYSNILTWTTTTDPECVNDISHYRIYYATTPNAPWEEYKLLVDLADRPLENTYTDGNLTSFARCYKLVVVDRSGNESEPSGEVCNDNCPNYELPNVFTPGNGDDCNDEFSAFSDRTKLLQCGTIDDLRKRCPRFVQRVEITIINRWGQTVLNYTSGGENNIYVDWDGTDDNGQKVAAGVYFYSAKVTYNMLNPKDREEIINGWIHLIRAD
jgi:CHU_C Type IX secretion signal domain